MNLLLPPIKLAKPTNPSVFLAGSIEMGKAIDWQSSFTKSLELYDVTVFNPRRTDWDSSWEQNISNPQFKEQVTWELDALEMCDVIALFFQPCTMSPISLLEFGLYARSNKLVVCCPEGFWRKGNVDILCRRFNIIQVETLPQLMEAAMIELGIPVPS